MSRSFNGTTSNYLSNTSAIITAQPISVFCWVRLNATNAFQTFWACVKHNDVNGNTQMRVGASDSATLFMTTYNATTTLVEYSTSGSFSTDTWTPVVAVWAGATDRRMYFGSSANKTSFTASQAFGGTPTRTVIGCSLYNTSTYLQAINGYMSHVSVWTTALTDGEAEWLCNGGHPLLVQRTSMVGYAPLTTNASPEPDWVWGQNYTVTGATYSTSDPSIGRSSLLPARIARQAVTSAATR